MTLKAFFLNNRCLFIIESGIWLAVDLNKVEKAFELHFFTTITSQAIDRSVTKAMLHLQLIPLVHFL